MPQRSLSEAVSRDLYSSREDLESVYPPSIVEGVIRVRAMHQMLLEDPSMTDRDFVAKDIELHEVSRQCAYRDLSLVRSIAPNLGKTSREWARYRYGEMILETYNKAKAASNLAVMERAATSFAKFSRIDEDAPERLPLEKILIQPFTATENPECLGIERIPDLQNRIEALKKRYSADNSDMLEVSYEVADLEETDYEEILTDRLPDYGEEGSIF